MTKFTLEVEEDLNQDQMDKILSDMEEIIGKADLSLYYSDAKSEEISDCNKVD